MTADFQYISLLMCIIVSEPTQCDCYLSLRESRSWWAVLDTTLNGKVCHWLAVGRFPVPIKLTASHDMAEIHVVLLKLMLNINDCFRIFHFFQMSFFVYRVGPYADTAWYKTKVFIHCVAQPSYEGRVEFITCP